MIHSSLFSHDDSSLWDPKASGQILRISDDQLQILNNLPEWSKVIAKDSFNLGITKESDILTSQSFEVGSQISKGNPEIHQNTKNSELFDKNQHLRREILKTFELNTRKRSKSSSLIEIGKHSKDLPNFTALKRISSTPDIHLRNFHPKEICYKFNSTEKHSLNITYSISSTFQNKSKDIFSNTVEVDSSSDQNLNIAKYKSNETKFRNLKLSSEDMEVITQQPVNINALKANVSEVEKFDSTQEKLNKLSNYTELQKLNSLECVEQISNGNQREISKLVEENQSPVFIDEECKELDNLRSEKAVISHECENMERSGQISSIISEQVVETMNLACDKVEFDSCIKPVFENNASSDNQECINLDTDKVEKSEIAKNSPEQQCFSNKYSSDIVDVQNSNKSPQTINVSNTSPDNLAAVETSMTYKRKAESKKSSRKRRCLQEKKKETDVRSLKKAGDISYSFEDIEILLDLIKQFL